MKESKWKPPKRSGPHPVLLGIAVLVAFVVGGLLFPRPRLQPSTQADLHPLDNVGGLRSVATLAPEPTTAPTEPTALFSGSPDVQLAVGGFRISEQQFADCMNLALLNQPRLSYCPDWPLLKARLLGYDVADLVPDWQVDEWYVMQRSMDDFRNCVALQEQSGVVRDCNPLLEPHHEAYQRLVNGGVR